MPPGFNANFIVDDERLSRRASIRKQLEAIATKKIRDRRHTKRYQVDRFGMRRGSRQAPSRNRTATNRAGETKRQPEERGPTG